TNDVAKVAANVTVANKAFKYTDANTLAIDQVTHADSTDVVLGLPSGADAQQALMNGISTRGGAVVVDTRSTGTLTVNQAIATTPTTAGANRSEERRVGKEGRSRWGRDTYKKSGANNAAGTGGNAGEVLIHPTDAAAGN